MKKQKFNNYKKSKKKKKPNYDNTINNITLLDNDYSNYNEIIDQIDYLFNNFKISLKNKSYIKLFYAKTLLEHGEYNIAFNILKEVEIENNNKNQFITSSSLIEQGILHKNIEDYDQSEYLLKKAYKNGEKLFAPIELGNLYKLKNDLEQAQFYYNKTKSLNFKNYYNLILSINNEQFQEAHDLIITMPNNLKFLRDYLTLKLNLSNDVDNSSYLLPQLINYNKDEALKHIIQHSFTDNTKKLHSIFDKDYNIESKFNVYSNIITIFKPYNKDIVNTYLIEEIFSTGKLKNYSTNYIKIITNSNDNIINMYPAISHYTHDAKKIDKTILNNNTLIKKHIT